MSTARTYWKRRSLLRKLPVKPWKVIMGRNSIMTLCDGFGPPFVDNHPRKSELHWRRKLKNSSRDRMRCLLLLFFWRRARMSMSSGFQPLSLRFVALMPGLTCLQTVYLILSSWNSRKSWISGGIVCLLKFVKNSERAYMPCYCSKQRFLCNTSDLLYTPLPLKFPMHF